MKDDHGTVTTYRYWKCRCSECCAANTRRCAQWRSGWREDPADREMRLLQQERHTGGARYNKGCRCDDCRAGVRERQRRSRERKRQPA